MTAASGESSSKLLVPGRVTATGNIPQGAMSMPIVAEKLKGQPDVVQISVGVNCFGTIELEKTSRSSWKDDIHWIRALRLSDDCHSYNIQLRLLTSTKQSTSSIRSNFQSSLVLQCVRPIEPGQELLLWFSEEILAMLQIVFLTPSNIQGQKKYVCTKCSAMYESPNPLKLHVTLSCGKHAISWLWSKLSNMLPENTSHINHTKQEFNFKLFNNTAGKHENQKNAIDLTVTNSPTSSDSRHSHLKENNLEKFKPFIKKPPTNNLQIPDQNQFYPQWPMSISYPEDFIPVPFDFAPTTHHQRPEDEAEIETLFSTLGKSKQGHICLYCGKCYSRKYGLKIHIRTHTGYKPLKCKYCLRPFGDPSNLNKHVRLHAAGDTPYKCDLCGKVLVRRRDLDRHLKSRHMSDMHPESSATSSNSNEEMTLTSDEDDPISVD
nr:zinc finger and SCAN domain-containing protein 20 [Onthophagus taurus]